ncbi:MAG: response regulator [Bacteroidota bacterium]|nr:response regulator [Bacteroidota bacterium]
MGKTVLEKCTLLYVDDSDANLYLFEENFSEEYNVLTALSGAEALEIVKEKHLDVIISDQAMPKMTGVEFFENVMRINPGPNRILLTAYSDIKALADAVNKTKIYQYVNKPWDYEKLKTIIDHAINEYKLRESNVELTQKLKKQTEELQELLKSKTELLNQLEKSNEALEKSEIRLKRIIDLSPIPIFVEDFDGNLNILNDQFKAVFGYTLKDIPNADKWYELAYPDTEYRKRHKQIWDNQIKLAIENNTVMEPIEAIVRCKSGENKVIQIQSSPIDNNIVTMINDLTKVKTLEKDISFRIKMEEELRSAKQKADAASKSKSEFIASMSHEIRTPMNSILGFADLLEQELDNSVMVDYVKSIQSSGKTLLSLINDILDFSKIEAGKTEIKYESVHIRGLIQDIAEIFKFSAKEKNLDLVTELDDHLPDYLMLDELRIKQILLNLVSNAVKFTENGFVKISANVNKISEENVELSIKVKDTGIGIDSKQQEKVFKVFEQMEGQDNKRYGGTGLGLAISNKLASLMDGKILLESKKNKGSTFTLTLNNVEIAGDTDEQKTVLDSGNEKINFKPAKVLIVDDNESNRKVLQLKLMKYNFEIFEVTNGIQALSILKNTIPDIMFIDLNMPEMNGYELYEKICENYTLKNIPAIAVTAFTLDHDEEKVLNAGFAGYVSKPVDFKIIFSILKKYIEYEELTETEDQSISYSQLELKEEALKNLPFLLRELEEQSAPYLEKMQHILPKKVVAGFAQMLISMGEKYNNKAVTNYGHEIMNASKAFNVEKEKELIKRFKPFVEKFKNLLP